MDFESNGLLSFAEDEPPRPSQMSYGSPPPDLEEEPEEEEDEGMDVDEEVEERRVDKGKGRAVDLFDSVDELRGGQMAGNGLLEMEAKETGSLLNSIPLPVPLVGGSSFAYRPRMLPIEATTSSGKTIVFKRQRRAEWTGQAARPEMAPSGSVTANLLEVPIHRLLQEIEDDASAKLASSLNDQYAREALRQARSKNGGYSAEKEKSRKLMWVDKYRPQKFTDLLGEERCHREVLGWLKEWDKCVFKKSVPGKKKVKVEEDEFVYVDALGRPRERILLMSGPPGLGKTTLAHIVAASAGYKVLEINASDDRSAATVTSRIQNAIDAGSGLAAGGKPTCVVIDEIDGASGGGDQSFIRSLVKLIQDVPARKGSKKVGKVLRRPIICICNDLYATSLRPLRQFARIIRFRKAQPALMVKRLRDICDKEGLTADSRSLTTLIEITGGDVRSCLNTLQFIKSKSNEVTDKLVKSSTIGLKDAGSNINAVWANLFVPLSVKKRKMGKGVQDGKYVNRLAFELQACGEYDKIVQGCFEHYPNLKPIDHSLENVGRVHDWIHFYDRLSHKVGSDQSYELMGYMPYAVVPWHHHMAAPANTTRAVEYPKADYEAFLKSTTNMEIATTLTAAIPPSLRGLYTASSTLTELAPLLMRIISPNLRPVNANLVKPEERIILTRLVDLMISLNLRFHRDKTEEGQPVFRLDPPIDVFIHYDGKRAGDVAVSRFAVRQLVAQAIDAELIKRKGALIEAGGGGKDPLHAMFKSKAKDSDAVDIADRPPTDFFGRLVERTDGEEETGPGSKTPVKKFRVMYKFNEGSSSAVRKPIKMSALL